MEHKFSKIFGYKKKIIIGAIHLPPLSGYPEFPGLETAVTNALEDLKTFESGGVDAIIFENNYDIPHFEFVTPEVVDCLATVGKKIKDATKLPVGVSVLWNDYKTALSLAKSLNLHFIRVPVFIDHVKSRYGEIVGEAKKIIDYRMEIGADEVAIFTDIHVKHSEILSNTTITEAAKLAVKSGSDGLIITGKWTGDAPNFDDLQTIRVVVGNFPIIAGSGCNTQNVSDILKYADAVIVSTALKEGGVHADEVDNLKSWQQRIDQKKVSEFVRAAKKI